MSQSNDTPKLSSIPLSGDDPSHDGGRQRASCWGCRGRAIWQRCWEVSWTRKSPVALEVHRADRKY